MIAKPKKHSGMKAICGSDLGAVITPGPARSPKKEGFFTKAKAVIFDGKSPTDAGRSRTPPKPSNGSSYASYPPNNHAGGGASVTLPRLPKQEDHRNQPASSSHGDRNGSQHSDSYQIRPPPPGSYQDDDTGPSPKNLVMAVMGVKSAVNHFAKVLISDMSKHPEELRHLEQLIRREVQADVDRANHWKFLVQAFVCKRLFEGFETKNGFFGIEYFDGSKMSFISSFMDFTKFKDKAATISELLAKQSEDESFLGKYCFKKFKSISGDLATNQPLPMYEEDWSMVERERHPQSEFYQSFLKVAVSVWLLHRLVYSFEQGWSILGWETFPKGSKFQRKTMESVVPGGFEEEDEETGTDVSAVVGFLVIPGFQVSKSVVKCEVYLPNKNNLKDGKIMEATGVPSGDKPLEDVFSDKRSVSYSQTPEKSYTSPASHQTPEKSYTSPPSHQTPEKSYTSPANHQTPEKRYTSAANHQTPEKRYTSAASHQTPEKRYTSPASLSHASLRGLQTTESFRSTTNHSGRSSRSPADKQAAEYWTDPQTTERLGSLSHRSRNDQNKSSLGRSTGQLESKGRAQTTHRLPMAPDPSVKQSGSRPPGFATRDTCLSRQRAASNKRTVR